MLVCPQVIGAVPIYRPVVRRCAPQADKSAVGTVNRPLRPIGSTFAIRTRLVDCQQTIQTPEKRAVLAVILSPCAALRVNSAKDLCVVLRALTTYAPGLNMSGLHVAFTTLA